MLLLLVNSNKPSKHLPFFLVKYENIVLNEPTVTYSLVFNPQNLCQQIMEVIQLNSENQFLSDMEKKQLTKVLNLCLLNQNKTQYLQELIKVIEI